MAEGKMIDKEVFTGTILMMNDRLYRMAKSLLGDEHKAQDVIQDLYLKMWEKRAEMKQVQNVTAYTLRVLRNLCLDRLKKKITETTEIDVEIVSSQSTPYDAIKGKDIRKIISENINRLPELQRTIIRLRDVEGFEISEISYITSTNENAVKVNLSRARQKIRTQLIALEIRNI